MRISTSVACVFLAVLTFIGGCGDKGTEPTAVEYLLYIGMHEAGPEMPEGFVAIVDCRTDSILDTLLHNFEGVAVATASTDGRYLTTVSASVPPVVIWDAGSLTPLVELPRFLGGVAPVLLPDEGIFLIPDLGETRIYRLSDFELDTTVAVELMGAQRIPGTQYVIGVDQRLRESFADDSKLSIFDYKERREVDSIIIDANDEGEGYEVGQFDFSPDGKILYAVGAHPKKGIGPSFAAYDLVERRVLYIQSVRTGVYGFGVTPDGTEVWTAYPGPAVYDDPAKTIDIWDAATGTLIDSVLLTGFRESPELSLAANSIEFVPGEYKAYVSCGSFFRPKGPQPVLVINTHSREVTKLLYPEFTNLAATLSVAPKP